MFLDLLMFFGSFVLGAIACNALMYGRRRTVWLPSLVICTSLGYLVLAFHLPFRSLRTELACTFAGILAVILVMLAMPIGRKDLGTSSKLAEYASAVVIIFWPLVSFTTVGRIHEAQKVATRFDGIVAMKYHSSNHNVPSIVVTQGDGSSVTMEGIDLPAWNAIREGRTHVNKSAWSDFGDIDGKQMRIVPNGMVMFLGPFPD